MSQVTEGVEAISFAELDTFGIDLLIGDECARDRLDIVITDAPDEVGPAIQEQRSILAGHDLAHSKPISLGINPHSILQDGCLDLVEKGVFRRPKCASLTATLTTVASLST